MTGRLTEEEAWAEEARVQQTLAACAGQSWRLTYLPEARRGRDLKGLTDGDVFLCALRRESAAVEEFARRWRTARGERRRALGRDLCRLDDHLLLEQGVIVRVD